MSVFITSGLWKRLFDASQYIDAEDLPEECEAIREAGRIIKAIEEGGYRLVRWQPISTAPVNEIVIVYTPRRNGQPYRGEAVKFSWGEWRWADDDPFDPDGPPTHWQPLPAPPQE